MEAAVRALTEKLGDDAMAGLRSFIDEAGRQWKDDMLAIAGERFERRLGHEIGAFRVDVANQFAAFRVDMGKEFAAVRADAAKEFAAVRAEAATEFAAMRIDMANGLGAVRAEMANDRLATTKEFAALRVQLATGLAATGASVLRWSFLFWVGQLAAMTGIMTLLLRTIVPR